MVDSNDRERLIEAREELERMTQEEELRDSILLVFANKQDLPSACSVGEVADALGLQSMRNRQVSVEQAVDSVQWRNVGGLVEKAPLGGKKSPPSGAPGLRAYWGQFVKIWPKNLNK